MDYTQLISKRKERFAALEEAVGDPDLFSDPKRATEILREHRKLKQTLDLWETLRNTETQLEDNRELAKADDKEFAAMAAEEIPELEKSVAKLREDMQYALLPADPNEDRDALVEIRAGAGGDEASLFAGEMMRAYQRYADAKGWKSEHLESSPSEVGGFKEVILKITGDEVFRHMKYESGVHRVQRVPATETQGRIHTSTITVAVLPEAEEIDVDMNPNDLRIEVCRSGGAGGQGPPDGDGLGGSGPGRGGGGNGRAPSGGRRRLPTNTPLSVSLRKGMAAATAEATRMVMETTPITPRVVWLRPRDPERRPSRSTRLPY
jgi:peptide chain release factor 1